MEPEFPEVPRRRQDDRLREAAQGVVYPPVSVYDRQHRGGILRHLAGDPRHGDRAMALRQRCQGDRICSLVRWPRRTYCAPHQNQQRFWERIGLSGGCNYVRSCSRHVGMDVGIPHVADVFNRGNREPRGAAWSDRQLSVSDGGGEPLGAGSISPATRSHRILGVQERSISSACRFQRGQA